MRRKRARSKPPFFRQETPDSCAAACLRSVLRTLDYISDEATLRKCCGTSATGTLSDDVVKCARRLGFDAKKEYSNLENLRQYLAVKRFPILYLNLLFIDGIDSVHAMVASGVHEKLIEVIDPLEGNRTLPLVAFEKSWEMLNNLMIIVW